MGITNRFNKLTMHEGLTKPKFFTIASGFQSPDSSNQSMELIPF